MTEHRHVPRRVLQALLLAATLAAAGCGQPPEPATATLSVHTDTATLTVAPPGHEQIDAIAYLVREHLAQNLRQLDETHPASDIAKINRTATTVRLPISTDTFRILDLGQYYSRLTDGFFDYTLGPVAYLWGFKQPLPPDQAPTEELLYDTLGRTGMDKVQLFDDNSIAITSPGARIELGPIREAYAVDLAVVDLRRRGYDGLRLACGQAVRALGTSLGGTSWTHRIVLADGTGIGVLRLDPDTAPAAAWVSLDDHALVVGGRPVSMYLNPATGRPADRLRLVAVTGPTATKAMALAQAVLVAGLDRAAAFLPRFVGYDLLTVDAATGDVRITPGMADRFAAASAPPGRIQLHNLTAPAASAGDADLE